MKKIKYTEKELSKNMHARNLKFAHVKRKELYETSITLDKSLKVIKQHYGTDRLHTVYDFCSGHTFNGYYAVSKNYSKFAVCIDIKFPKSSYRLETLYNQRLRVEHREEDIYKTDYNLNPNSVVLSIHPCKTLSYRVTDIAIKNKLPIVIVPCCECKSPHSTSLHDLNIINKYTKHCLGIIMWLEHNNYTIRTKEINQAFTPKNMIIIGIPN